VLLIRGWPEEHGLIHTKAESALRKYFLSLLRRAAVLYKSLLRRLDFRLF
jgi:hypothetical protein